MPERKNIDNGAKKFWDQIAGMYDDEILNTLQADRRGVLGDVITRYASGVSLAADLGCGVGRFVPLLSSLAAQVCAVDFSQASIDLAKASCSHLANVELDCVDLSIAKQKICHADVGLSINVLVMPDRKKRQSIFQNTCRNIRKGGTMITVVPSLESALYSYQRLAQWYEREGDSENEAIKMVANDIRAEVTSLVQGHVKIAGTTTKHFLREEALLMFAEKNFELVEESRVELAWTEEYDSPPKWLKEPFLWDWLFVTRRTR